MMSQSPATSTVETKKWIILLTVIIGTFLGRLDQTIVNLALPKIIDDFGITVTSGAWIATAYILANAVFVPIWGKLGDTMGRKRVYILGFSLFIASSLLAGLAWNLPSLIFFRVIQAIAGSADYPTAMAIIAVTYTGEKERAQALGLWSASFAAAAVFGPLIGGPLIDSFSWRAVFLINLPVGIVGLLMAFVFIHESISDHKSRSFDLLGALTLGVTLCAIVLVLDQGLDWGWLSLNSMLCYIISLIGFFTFLSIERRHPEPIVHLKFFSSMIFIQALLNNFIIFMGMMGSIFLVPIFAQTFLGYDATHTGYLFIPMAAALMISSPVGGSLTGKIQPRIVIALSTAVAALGLGLFSLLDPRSGSLSIIVPLAIMAGGMGFAMAQRTNIIASVVPTHEVGVASSILALVRNIAGAFGIAIFGTILNNSIEYHVLDIARRSTLFVHNARTQATFSALITLKAQIDGYHTVFLSAGILVFFGALLALTMRNIDMKSTEIVHAEA